MRLQKTDKIELNFPFNLWPSMQTLLCGAYIHQSPHTTTIARVVRWKSSPSTSAPQRSTHYDWAVSWAGRIIFLLHNSVSFLMAAYFRNDRVPTRMRVLFVGRYSNELTKWVLLHWFALAIRGISTNERMCLDVSRNTDLCWGWCCYLSLRLRHLGGYRTLYFVCH